jgi:hypothetical protein
MRSQDGETSAEDWANGFHGAMRLGLDHWKPVFETFDVAAPVMATLVHCTDPDGVSIYGDEIRNIPAQHLKDGWMVIREAVHAVLDRIAPPLGCSAAQFGSDRRRTPRCEEAASFLNIAAASSRSMAPGTSGHDSSAAARSSTCATVERASPLHPEIRRLLTPDRLSRNILRTCRISTAVPCITHPTKRASVSRRSPLPLVRLAEVVSVQAAGPAPERVAEVISESPASRGPNLPCGDRRLNPRVYDGVPSI